MTNNCNTCNHCGRQTSDNQGWCNLGFKFDKRPVLVKLNDPACDHYFTGKLWRDRFGFRYKYCWQTNSFVCDQTGYALDFNYLESLREILQ